MTDRDANRLLLAHHLMRKHKIVLDYFTPSYISECLTALENGTKSLDEVADEIAATVDFEPSIVFHEGSEV